MNKSLQTFIGIVLLGLLIVGVAVYSKRHPLDKTAPGDMTGQEPAGKLPAGSPANGDVSMLTAHTWVWEKTVMNDGAVIVPKKPGTFALMFATDGQLSGKTDCNGFGGTYTIGADKAISFGPFMSTQMFCEGSQEAVFTTMVSQSNRFMMTDADDLVLLLNYDSGSVMFKKQ